ncbi:MAG: glutamine-hydrolyzing GMP synthase [Caldilineae bacterium]|nr:glutamine-hydrolyzing GMP synthase [Chloroflexota bacterium]MCB9177405.1 glutamine-hydrolyzing GMP synthase [Caldilineae bacterium]
MSSPQPGLPPGTETIAIIDYGGQTAQLIARRVREHGVFCELLPWDAPRAVFEALAPRGYILSGGPESVYAPDAPSLPSIVLESGVPVLGICYGMQLLSHALGGRVAPSAHREYGLAELERDAELPLFRGLPQELTVWMSHADRVDMVPDGFRALGHTRNAPAAIMGDPKRGLYAVQFHPEVTHTPFGSKLLGNFVLEVCGCRGDWTPARFIETAVDAIREQVGDGSVLVAISGGVDSSVTAALVHRAIGDRMHAFFIDHGLLRQDEPEDVARLFASLGISVTMVDAADGFLAALAGVEDPETKRKIIGTCFVREFERQAASVGQLDFLAQGTLYPDVIESATSASGSAHKIKTHHNVGGLPEDIEFGVIEPLRFLFKDEVRRVGRELGLPEKVVMRQPFPGPGLAVRILGEVSREKLATLRQADAILRQEIEARAGELGDEQPWQYFAVLTPLRSVGVMGDQRTYGNLVGIRAVTSLDGMTADWARLPADLLTRIATRIVNEVAGVNRVVYDISSKPPSTIEWE